MFFPILSLRPLLVCQLPLLTTSVSLSTYLNTTWGSHPSPTPSLRRRRIEVGWYWYLTVCCTKNSLESSHVQIYFRGSKVDNRWLIFCFRVSDVSDLLVTITWWLNLVYFICDSILVDEFYESNYKRVLSV